MSISASKTDSAGLITLYVDGKINSILDVATSRVDYRLTGASDMKSWRPIVLIQSISGRDFIRVERDRMNPFHFFRREESYVIQT